MPIDTRALTRRLGMNDEHPLPVGEGHFFCHYDRENHVPFSFQQGMAASQLGIASATQHQYLPDRGSAPWKQRNLIAEPAKPLVGRRCTVISACEIAGIAVIGLRIGGFKASNTHEERVPEG